MAYHPLTVWIETIDGVLERIRITLFGIEEDALDGSRKNGPLGLDFRGEHVEVGIFDEAKLPASTGIAAVVEVAGPNSRVRPGILDVSDTFEQRGLVVALSVRLHAEHEAGLGNGSGLGGFEKCDAKLGGSRVGNPLVAAACTDADADALVLDFEFRRAFAV